MPFFELETSIPFRVHCNADDVSVQHLRWLQEMGLIDDPETARDYSRQGAVSAMTYMFPQIPYEGLCLAADMAGITVFLDDYCSAHAKEPEQVARLINSLIAITREPIEEHHLLSNPILRGWSHTWKRYGHGMSTRWQERTQGTWHDFLSAWIDEAEVHASDAYMELDAFLPLRRRAIGVRPFVDVAQWATQLELPPHLVEHPATQQALDACTDVCIYINDIFSLEREVRAKEKNNFVLIVQQQDNLSDEQAVSVAIKKCVDSYQLFELKKNSLSLLAVSPHEQQAMDSFIDLLCSFVRGSHDWSRCVERYGQSAFLPAPTPYLARCEYLSDT